MKLRIIRYLLIACVALSLNQAAWGADTDESTDTPVWPPLAQDDLHDPQGPGLKMLQNPAEALSPLPQATGGNYVNWVKALKTGAIKPLSHLYPQTEVKMLDLDVMLTKRASAELNNVVFPHRRHTEWLDCKDCHEGIFKSQNGANNITMLAILNGEFCGRCHGAVAFPLTECNRCHNVPPKPAKKRQ